MLKAEEDEDEGVIAATGVARGVAVSTHAREGLERARVFAEHAAAKIHESFPAWTIETRVYPDSPAWGLLYAAQKWNPDLIVLGSHGRSLIGRFFLGSVSQKVLSEALCSVRIARHRDTVAGSPVRLLAGVDGTPDSDAAIDEIASRRWPAGSSISLLSAIGPIGAFIDPGFAYDATPWVESDAGQWERMEQTVNNAAAKLRESGLLVNTVIRDGAPVPLLCDEAETLGADCIFLGARGHRFMERFLLGSVSAAVAARASCSVEIVRTAKAAGQDTEP